MAVTFLIFIATFVTLACLGLPLAILAAFAALTREKAVPSRLPPGSAEAAGERGGSIRGSLV